MDNLRLDKNLAFNILEIQDISSDKQTQIIIKSLIIYFSYSYQEDLFGYMTLDPYDFAKKMNIGIGKLREKHPNPSQVIKSKYSKDYLYKEQEINGDHSSSRIWDTYLENALYILSSTPIFDTYNTVTEEFNIVGLKNFILIKEVELYVQKTNKGRNQKFFYKYKLDTSFERNLRRFFLQTNFNTYLLCKKDNTEDLYLNIVNIYHKYKMKGVNQFHWKLKNLIRYFNI